MSSAANKTAILILAAGESRRLGTPKQLITIEGKTLVHRLARRAADSTANKVLVVLGHEASEIEPELHDIKNVSSIHNPDYRGGMGTSIRSGVESIIDSDAILISVCDQPHLTTDIFNQLIARIPNSSSGIVASRYADTLGVPAIFSRQHFPALLALADDAGAKCLFTNDVGWIDFPGGSVDIDTPEDLAELIAARLDH